MQKRLKNTALEYILLMRPPLQLLRGINGNAEEKIKVENDDLKVRSIKNYKSSLECLVITVLVPAFNAKTFQ